MEEKPIVIKFEDMKEPIYQALRDIVILEIGGIWENYCFENNVSPDLKIHFLDYLNRMVDKITK